MGSVCWKYSREVKDVGADEQREGAGDWIRVAGKRGRTRDVTAPDP